MSRKNEEVNKLTGNRINNAIISKYGDKRGKQADFRRDYEKITGCMIDKKTVSDLIKGQTTLASDRAIEFSKVLNTSAEYLLGLTDFMNPEKRREQIENEITLKWSQEDYQKIDLCKRIMLLLAKDHRIIFDAYENQSKNQKKTIRIDKKIIYQSNSIKLYDPDKKNTPNYLSIIPEGFYNWICTPDLTVLIKKDSNNQSFRYIHLADNVSIVKKSDPNISLNLGINGFLKLIYDIDSSMTAAMNSRLDFYFKYSNYNYFEDLRHDYEDYDLI